MFLADTFRDEETVNYYRLQQDLINEQNQPTNQNNSLSFVTQLLTSLHYLVGSSFQFLIFSSQFFLIDSSFMIEHGIASKLWTNFHEHVR